MAALSGRIRPSPYEHKEDSGGYETDENKEDRSTTSSDGVDVQKLARHDADAAARHVSNIAPEVLTTDPRQGLTSTVAAARLLTYGCNEIQEHKPMRLLKFLGYFTDPLVCRSYVFAALLSCVMHYRIAFGIMAAIALVDACLGFIIDRNLASEVDAVKSTSALRCRVMRDGHMVEMEARCIVPGDIISLYTGDVVSADAIVLPRVHRNAVYKGVNFGQACTEEPPGEAGLVRRGPVPGADRRQILLPSQTRTRHEAPARPAVLVVHRQVRPGPGPRHQNGRQHRGG